VSLACVRAPHLPHPCVLDLAYASLRVFLSSSYAGGMRVCFSHCCCRGRHLLPASRRCTNRRNTCCHAAGAVIIPLEESCLYDCACRLATHGGLARRGIVSAGLQARWLACAKICPASCPACGGRVLFLSHDGCAWHGCTRVGSEMRRAGAEGGGGSVCLFVAPELVQSLRSRPCSRRGCVQTRLSLIAARCQLWASPRLPLCREL
jgi:hypothetical protein